MYYEHPFKIDGVYYAKIDGELIEITEELAKAMLSFYRLDKRFIKRWMPDLKSKEEEKKEETELQLACGDLIQKMKEEELKKRNAAEAAKENLQVENNKQNVAVGKSKRKDFRREMILDCVFRENTEGLTIEDLPGSMSVEQQVLKSMEYDTLHQVLALLSEEERILIDAVYFRKIPQATIAKKYGVTPPAINKKLKCVLVKIRSLYADVIF